MSATDRGAEKGREAAEKGREVAAHAQAWGRRLNDSSALRRAVQVGLVAYAVLHLLVGYVAVRLALGERSGSASTDGALSQLADETGGHLALGLMALGFAALVVARLLAAVYSHRDEEGARAWLMPAYSSLRAVLYGALAWSTAKIALGQGSGGGSGSADTMSAQLMSAPGGRVLVGLIGVVVWGYAGGLIVTGVTGGYRDMLSVEGWRGNKGGFYDTVARIGHLGKGSAFVLIGGLFVGSAIQHDAQQSGGLDQALRELTGQPYGRVAVVVVALGFAAYGGFALIRARHLRHGS